MVAFPRTGAVSEGVLATPEAGHDRVGGDGTAAAVKAGRAPPGPKVPPLRETRPWPRRQLAGTMRGWRREGGPVGTRASQDW
jgi:hypothetical protein